MCTKKVTEFFSGLLAVIFSAIYYSNSRNIKSIGLSQVGADLFPKMISLLLLIIGVYLMVKNSKQLWSFFKETKPSFQRLLFIVFVDYRKLIITMAFFTAYCFGVSIVGFLSATFVYLVLQILVFTTDINLKSTLSATAVSLSVSVLVYVIFTFALKISLPSGFLL